MADSPGGAAETESRPFVPDEANIPEFASVARDDPERAAARLAASVRRLQRSSTFIPLQPSQEHP